MTEDEENFRKWFVDMLERLRNEGNAGFVFALVSFPLLERYLRQKSGAGQKTSLPEQFFCELGKLFPGIAKREKDFWQCYRNGLLHQVAFSKERTKNQKRIEIMPDAALSGHDDRQVYFNVSENAFF